MALPKRIKSPKNWKKSSSYKYSGYKKPNRAKNPWVKKLDKNEPLGKKLIRQLSKLSRAYFAKAGSNWQVMFKVMVTIAIIGGLTGSVFMVAIFAWYSKDLPAPNKIIERNVAQSTKIYDRSGEHLLYEIHGDTKRTLIKLEDLPEYVKWAAIDLEDKNFYKHGGFSLWAIFRTITTNILRNERAGGSTLTQQFIKNAVLTTEKKYSRKIKELILSYQVEKKFSKDEILQMYFNEIPYGSTAYGIESATQNYFGKDAKNLTLAEAALLASITQRPSYLSPYGSHVDELMARQRYVLDLMVEHKHITKEEAEQAKEEKLKFKARSENISAPHFVLYVKEILTEKYGEKTVEQGGLNVYTTLDWDKQQIAEEAIINGIEKIEQYNGSNAALLSLDPKTGEILAMVGSRDYFDDEHDGQVNVTMRPRQPGSSFKPIVYTTAFEKGYTPNTVLYDVTTTFKNVPKDYEPKNYDLVEHGPVTIRKALAGSLNIPAVKAIYLAGIENVLNLAEKLGYTTFGDRSRFGLSLVLGGGEVRLLEHVAAFATLASEGTYHEPTTILKVEDASGAILEEFKKKSRDVLDKNIARTTTNILSDNEARAYVFGTDNYLHLGDRQVAAKTGTTNDYRDAWTVGYTPNLATGVWVGNNDNSEMKRGAAGGVVAAPIWNEYMKNALADMKIENFKEPKISETGKDVLDGKNVGQVTVKIDKASGKLATEYTPEHMAEEKTFLNAHSILYYIDKNDPLGDPPANPSNDPQFENWELAIQKWAGEEKLTTELPPTEYDDLHLPKYQPVINITSHNINQTITDRNINIEIQTSAPRGLRRVEYFIDNQKIGVSYSYPFNLNTHLQNISNGFHALKAIAFDDVDNNNTAEITLNFNLPEEPIIINWIGPKNNSSFYASSFPLTLTASLNLLANVKQVDFYYEDVAGISQQIDSIISPSIEFLEAHWINAPVPGEYKLYVEVTDELENKYQSVKSNIRVQ